MSIHERLAKHILADGLPIVADLEKSHGSWLVDAETGKEYLDCYSCHAAQALGWNHPSFKQYEHELKNVLWHKPSNSDLYTKEYADFVDAFAKITPDFSHYLFIDTGTLAVENSLKCAFDWKAQKLGWAHDNRSILDVIHFTDAFHGRSGYTMSVLSGENRTRWFPQFDWTRIPAPDTNQDVTIQKVENILEYDGYENVAAILVEPIASEGGDKHYTKEFFQELRRLADKYEVMLIFDEIQVGMGITGQMWAYEHYGVIPDMMTFGKKSFASGFCATARVDEVKDNVFKVSGRLNSTFAGNLIDMVRCRILLKIIENENLCQCAAKVGHYFLSRLHSLPLENIRGRGLLIAFDLSSPEERNKMFERLLNLGLLCLKCGEKSIRFRPHLTFSYNDADEAVKIISKSLE